MLGVRLESSLLFLSLSLSDHPLIFPVINLPFLRGWHLCPGMFLLTLLFLNINRLGGLRKELIHIWLVSKAPLLLLLDSLP